MGLPGRVLKEDYGYAGKFNVLIEGLLCTADGPEVVVGDSLEASLFVDSPPWGCGFTLATLEGKEPGSLSFSPQNS